MKTEFTPIAMRCTHEQWNSIKDELPKPVDVYFNLKEYPYLVNDFKSSTLGIGIGSVGFSYLLKRRNINETFNREIFLNACGIKTEKVWNSNELEFFNENSKEWVSLGNGTSKIRLKLKPNYDAEIAELERQIKVLKDKQ